MRFKTYTDDWRLYRRDLPKCIEYDCRRDAVVADDEELGQADVDVVLGTYLPEAQDAGYAFVVLNHGLPQGADEVMRRSLIRFEMADHGMTLFLCRAKCRQYDEVFIVAVRQPRPTDEEWEREQLIFEARAERRQSAERAGAGAGRTAPVSRAAKAKPKRRRAAVDR